VKELLNRLLRLPHGDKIAHALVGFVLALLGGFILGFWGAIIATVVIGTLKELWDSNHPEDHVADWKDALATFAGGFLALLPLYWLGIWNL